MRTALLLALVPAAFLVACDEPGPPALLAAPDSSAQTRLATCTTADCWGAIEGRRIDQFGDVIGNGHIFDPWPTLAAPTIPLAVTYEDGVVEVYEGFTGVLLATLVVAHGDAVTGVTQVSVTDDEGYSTKVWMVSTVIGQEIGWNGTLDLGYLIEVAGSGEPTSFDLRIEDWYYEGSVVRNDEGICAGVGGSPPG